jgi:hypothetical protein
MMDVDVSVRMQNFVTTASAAVLTIVAWRMLT